MRKLIATACAGVLAVATFGTSLTPASAAYVNGAELTPVANYHHHRPYFERRGNYAYYNGHRGYRHRRPGWRLYRGYWFPPAAFGAAIGGAIIGGILRNAR